MSTGPLVSIAAVGDLMVGDTAISVGYGFGSHYRADRVAQISARVRPLIEGATIVFGNLECALSRRGFAANDWQSAQMRGYPSYAQVLRDAGFTHLSVANNHAHQHGAAAFRETVAHLEEAGIQPCGLPGEDGWAAHPVEVACASGQVGLLAYSLRPRQYGSGPPPYAEGNRETVAADVRRLRARVDHVVVSLHWGEEYGALPSAAEVALGRKLVDEGASMVVGHHPHVIRPIEVYRGGVIAYSLGNFIADMVWQRAFRETLVLRCALGNGVTTELVPAWIGPDFLPGGCGPARWTKLTEGLVGLSPQAYLRQTRRSLLWQRIAAYRYAVAHLHRFNRRVLGQLVAKQLRNRWVAVSGG